VCCRESSPAGPGRSLGYGEHVFDASADRIIVCAGGGGVAETWRCDLRAGTWSSSGAETPVLKMAMWALPTIVYDEAAERTVVAADNGWGAYDATNDRWETLFDAEAGGMLPAPAVYDP